ncbi:hypothetical protein G9409_10130 [Chlorobium sp. BLA1]|nr:hypothetical protein [Candidatus Chlorobium masyuteum]
MTEEERESAEQWRIGKKWTVWTKKWWTEVDLSGQDEEILNFGLWIACRGDPASSSSFVIPICRDLNSGKERSLTAFEMTR